MPAILPLLSFFHKVVIYPCRTVSSSSRTIVVTFTDSLPYP